jgi:hypothetical protein
MTDLGPPTSDLRPNRLPGTRRSSLAPSEINWYPKQPLMRGGAPCDDYEHMHHSILPMVGSEVCIF